MLKVVGVIGYKNSGKTTLIRGVARELAERGHQVAVIKHTSHNLDMPGKDTALLCEVADHVGLISARESGIFWGRTLDLEEMIGYLRADIVLVEGFKAARSFPKIVCLREELDDPEEGSIADLFDGLTLCAVGPVESLDTVEVPVLARQEIPAIADLVEQKGFKLPSLNCGACGHERCDGLAREIVSGARKVEDCLSLDPDTEVKIEGEPLAMNPFVSSLVRGTVLGMLSPLKGFNRGTVELKIRL